MKKLSLLSLIMALVLVAMSCSAIQKNGKSKDNPTTKQEQMQVEDDSDEE